MKRFLSMSLLMLPLLALVSTRGLSAQTIVVDKPNLTLSGQVGGPVVSQTVHVSSSTGASIPFALSVPQTSPWLKINGQSLFSNSTLPFDVTITADPTGLAGGTLTASIAVLGGSNNSAPIAVTFNVSTIGVSPQTLSFSYTAGSNNFPAPQVLSLSSAVATQCTTSATTTGGSWIGPLQNPCVSPGSLTVQLNNSLVAGLATGTYTGTITIAPASGQGPPAIVSLILTVVPTPPVTVNPASLVLTYQTGIGAPNPSQVFTVSTTSSQQLTYSLIQSSNLTSTNISTISPSSGITVNGSAQITYTVNPAGLAAGTYTGKITLFTFGGTPPQQDIPVTLIVSTVPLLNVPTASLTFTSQLGSTPAAQTVNITATSGTLSYSVSTSNYNPSGNTGWLLVPNAGNTGTPLSVSVNPSGLPPGTYTANVNVLSATPGSAQQTFQVVLRVTNDAAITANVIQLNFPYQLGQLIPPAQTVRLSSTTGAPLSYTASFATSTPPCHDGWLQVANANNSLSGVTDDTLTFSVNIATLGAPFTCQGVLTVNATNPATGAAAVNSPITIAVSLFLSNTAQLVLTPTVLQPFTVAVGAQNPSAQSITLTSTNTDVLSYSVAFQSTGGSWLFAGPQNGTTTASGNGNVVTVSVIPGGLAAGVYTGTVTITATGPGGAAVADSPLVIPVTLNVSGGTLVLGATDITFPDQTSGGPAPASRTIGIASSGQALNYSAVANSNNSVAWLSVTPAGGNTSTNGSLTVAVDGSRLAPGTYNGTIVVTSPGASNSPQTINVHFKVNGGTLSAATTTLTFTQAAGGAAPVSQTISVTGNPAALSFTVTAATISGSNWLAATPATGTTPANVQVSVNGSSLAVGQYTGTVTIAQPGGTGNSISVGVILNVVTPAVLTGAPASLAFTYSIGTTAPAAQTITVTASGNAGTVPLTAQVQMDGVAGQWLTITPSSTVAPASFSVSVVPGNLTAGQYTGRIQITSPNSSATLTIPVTFTVNAIPQPVVTSVGNAANYATGAVSPGENIVIFGSGIGPATLAGGSIVNNVYTSLIGNTRVLFDNVAAPIIYASAGQTSVMVPYGVAGRTTTNIVVEYSGVQSLALAYNVVPSAPGIYTQNSSGSGPAAILNQDFSINGQNNPEKRGNVIAIYMTGEGQTTPQGADGAIIPAVLSALKKPNLTVSVTVGGIDAHVEYAGSAPGLVSGVMQVNVTIPPTAPTGTQPVVVTVGTAKSQSNATVAISNQ